ncbi:hypothetical protein EFP05_05805, partial [Lactiplantibacillus pentosus]|nr:hypothetical protein [Lactiplantibacillus pentosus]
ITPYSWLELTTTIVRDCFGPFFIFVRINYRICHKSFINVSNEISSRKLLTKSFVNSLFRLIERKISNLNINRISISKLKSYS